MFTGLVEEVGTIRVVERSGGGSRITVAALKVLEDANPGDSIAVDGACMTVVVLDSESFTVEVSPESLSKTNFGGFEAGTRVNLERPLTPASRIGGHYVTGHVDGLATLVSVEPQGNSLVYTFDVTDPALGELLIPKGSVAILGISLTVNTVSDTRFSVAIIPHTLAHTNLADYQPGDRVNIETDLLGKYVRRLLAGQPAKPTGPDTANSLPGGLQSNEVSGVLSDGARIDDAALAPAMNAIRTPTGANIRTGGWFNFETK